MPACAYDALWATFTRLTRIGLAWASAQAMVPDSLSVLTVHPRHLGTLGYSLVIISSSTSPLTTGLTFSDHKSYCLKAYIQRILQAHLGFLA